MPPFATLDESRFRASARRSRERRAAADRSRRRRSGGRKGAAVLVAAVLASSGAALATTTGGAEAGKAPKATAAKIVPLAVGSRGDAVRALQRKLRVSADGHFGPRTRAAVRRFQRRAGLRVTGVADAATQRALGLSARTTAAPAPAAKRGTAIRQAPATKAEAGTLARIARCESGGDPTAIGGGGRYRGKYQFSTATWQAMGGAGDPAAAPEAEQDARALALLRREGTSPWPHCGA